MYTPGEGYREYCYVSGKVDKGFKLSRILCTMYIRGLDCNMEYPHIASVASFWYFFTVENIKQA